ncbi:GtrA family protein [Actinocorallia longicatena]|uniref:Flippase GtrA n=1 Tax=Actinocorallia longicatena TaxID=111803 RepID=A0ABP6QC32_9ACTN
MKTTETPGPIASFIRFVVCGGGVTVLSSIVLVQLEARMSLLLANALITVVGTLLANELHSRISFGSDRRGWRMHLESTATAFAAWLVTSVAMLTLHHLSAHPAVLLEQAVYLTASGVAGLGRFLTLRLVVFAKKSSPLEPPVREEVVLAA